MAFALVDRENFYVSCGRRSPRYTTRWRELLTVAS
jgi:hypothetical protein